MTFYWQEHFEQSHLRCMLHFILFCLAAADSTLYIPPWLPWACQSRPRQMPWRFRYPTAIMASSCKYWYYRFCHRRQLFPFWKQPLLRLCQVIFMNILGIFSGKFYIPHQMLTTLKYIALVGTFFIYTTSRVFSKLASGRVFNNFWTIPCFRDIPFRYSRSKCSICRHGRSRYSAPFRKMSSWNDQYYCNGADRCVPHNTGSE